MSNKNALVLVFLSIGFISQPAFSQSTMSTLEHDEAIKIAESEGDVRVMVTLQTGRGLVDVLNAGGSPTDDINISPPVSLTNDFLQRLGQEGINVVKVFEETPTLVLDVTNKALDKITQDSLVTSVVYLPAETSF